MTPVRWWRRLRRWLLVALIVGGWTIVVAISAGRKPSEGSWVGVPDLSSAVIWTVIAVALLGLVVLSQLRSSGYAQGRPSGGVGSLLATTLAIVAVILLLMDDDVDLGFGEQVEEQEVEQPLGELESGSRSRLPESTVRIEQRDVGIGLAMAAMAVTAGLLLFRRQPEPIEEDQVRADDDDGGMGTEAVGDGLIDQLVAAAVHSRVLLDSIDDPRQAILSAYSHLEGVMAEHGHRRLGHETSSEHVSRVAGTQVLEPEPLVGLAVDPIHVGQLGLLET